MWTKRIAFAFLAFVAAIAQQQSQPEPGIAPPTILRVTIENARFYLSDTPDASKHATVTTRTDAPLHRNFNVMQAVGDVTEVNGTPVKGALSIQAGGMNVSSNPPAGSGQGIADTAFGGRLIYELEILKFDGTRIGTIFALGINGGGLPPGAPKDASALNFAVIGGTGAYLGARGQMQATDRRIASNQPQARASMTEDPALRRVHGGLSFERVIHLIDMPTPEIKSAWHADFTPVTAERPARPGELIILRATNLGPTNPGGELGEPFGRDPPQVVNSPVEVLAAGSVVPVVNAIGWPGERNLYRVDFRVPSEAPTGFLPVQLRSAWITGGSLSLPLAR